MADTLARQFANFAAALKYEDLPPAVVDKLKALLIHHLVSATFGASMPRGKEAIALAKAEDGKPDGATILGDGGKATRSGATYINSELMHTSGMYDSYRMITHPGPMIIPPALASIELEGRSGKDLLVTLAAAYEIEERLTDKFVPSTSAHGFRPSPQFGSIGASVATAKALDLDADGIVSAIALGATIAGGTNEGARAGGGENAIHDPHAAVNGVLAGITARTGHVKGSETSIEGRAGFLNAFTGSNTGRLTANYEGPLEIDLQTLTAGLGQRWELLTTMFRMYPTGGYNQPIIDLMVEMKDQHGLKAEDIDRVDIFINYIETLMPSPAFPREPGNPPRVGSHHYYAAHALVNGGFPQVGGRTYSPSADPTKDAQVLDFLTDHVRVVGVKDQPMFSPQAVIFMKDGRSFQGSYPYQRMEWDMAQLLERQQDPAANFPLGRGKFDDLVKTVQATETLPNIGPLLHTTFA